MELTIPPNFCKFANSWWFKQLAFQFDEVQIPLMWTGDTSHHWCKMSSMDPIMTKLEYGLELCRCLNPYCHDPNLGLMTKAVRGMERWQLKVQPRNHIHIFKSARKCEGMSPHTPKWASTLRVGVPRESQIFREKFEGSKTHWIEDVFIPLKRFRDVDVKMGLHDQFEYLQHKLWPKERLGIKVLIWLPTLKVRNHSGLRVCRGRATNHWKYLDEGYNFSWNFTLIEGLHKNVLGIQSGGSLKKIDIWVQPLWLITENTIRGKVVASLKLGPWWVFWIYVCSWFVHA